MDDELIMNELLIFHNNNNNINNNVIKINDRAFMPKTKVVMNDNRVFTWNHNDTLKLLDNFKKHRSKVGSLEIRNLKKLFEIISLELHKIHNIDVSPSNVENRWRVLERNYKKFVDNNKKTGKKKNIHPPLLLSSDTIDHMIETSSKKLNLIPAIGEEMLNEEELHGTEEPSTSSSDTAIASEVSVKNSRSSRLKTGRITKSKFDKIHYQKEKLDILKKYYDEKKGETICWKRETHLLKKEMFLCAQI
ncbi:hypothetical protein ABEB36_013584 [Hypothenemus hampei]|uniref:Myb/SANT-like DNA-binding domain-containing protein n=1 Tax=Hypothenemus hampei TaxID=57062 RepID=A0ABD1E5L2_HYPHA